jgi:hypothetical protein
MGEGILVGFWNVIVFFVDFLTKAIVSAFAAVLFQRVGLIVVGVAVLVALGVLLVRARRR